MNELLAFLRRFDITPPPAWEERIADLHRLLVDANRVCNLTRIVDFEEFCIKHVADSLLVVAEHPPLRAEDLRVADVGCGGGFPGLPLALFFPRLRLVEIDSAGRKLEWVLRFADSLGLANCRCLAGRARELARTEAARGAFDVVLARAVSSTDRLVRECRGLLAESTGVIIAYKTPQQIRDEREKVQREVAKHHLLARESRAHELPRGLGTRQFWIVGPREG